jgi:peptidoglycan/LPS O-acetylase OafA/YrhL
MSDLQAAAQPLASLADFRKRGYIPELDGVRALSVLLVVSTHMYDAGMMWRWLSGWQGVTIFFVLSGYLITSLALREERQRGRLSLSAFYVRRSFRIFPLYYFTLLLYCVLILGLGMAPGQREGLCEALPYFVFYLQEVPFYFVGLRPQGELPFFQSWSLGVEEKFYLLWPLLGFALWKGATALRRTRTFALVAAFVLLPVGIYLWNPDLVPFSRNLISYHCILAGCLLALLLDDERWFNRLRFLASPAGTVGSVALFLAVHFGTAVVPALYLWNIWGVLYSFATAAMLGSVLLGTGPLQTFLARPALVFIGRLSYGIYLIHLFVIGIAHRLVPSWLPFPWAGLCAYFLACVLSIGFAWVLAWAFERRFIAWGQRLSAWILARSAAAVVPSVSQARISVNDLASHAETASPRAGNSILSPVRPVSRA